MWLWNLTMTLIRQEGWGVFGNLKEWIHITLEILIAIRLNKTTNQELHRAMLFYSTITSNNNFENGIISTQAFALLSDLFVQGHFHIIFLRFRYLGQSTVVRVTIVRVMCRTIFCCTCRFGKHNYFPCHFIYAEGLSYGPVFITVSKHRTDIISNNIALCHRGRIQRYYATVWFIRTPCIKFRYMISLYEFTVFLIATRIPCFRKWYLNRITNNTKASAHKDT